MPTQTASVLVEDDNISECSDVEEEGYADFTVDDLEPFIFMVDGMQLKPTNNERVRQKFDNHQQVMQVFRSLKNIFFILWLFIYFLLNLIFYFIHPISVVYF